MNTCPAHMNVGDCVRLIAIPDALASSEGEGLDTNNLFQRCLGRVFPIAGFNRAGLAELEIGEVDGLPSYMISIWVEPKFLALAEGESS